jgi:hypothetical protein
MKYILVNSHIFISRVRIAVTEKVQLYIIHLLWTAH